jgi:hypothetical protein
LAGEVADADHGDCREDADQDHGDHGFDKREPSVVIDGCVEVDCGS